MRKIDVVTLEAEKLNKAFENGSIDLEEDYYPNSFIVYKSDYAKDKTRISRVDHTGKKAKFLSEQLTAGRVAPRNKEQHMAMDLLLDDSVPVVVLTGSAGVGKTYISLAAAIHKYESKKYQKIILSRPMSQVGRFDLGLLPGNVQEKLSPYLGNFETNLGMLTKNTKLEDFIEQYSIECIPIQLMRGCSFANSFIIMDEMQVCNFHEMLTVGTRVAEGSKIVIMGDMAQRDIKIDKVDTGIHKITHSDIMKNSPLVGMIELLKSERGPVSALFSKTFEDGSIDEPKKKSTRK